MENLRRIAHAPSVQMHEVYVNVIRSCILILYYPVFWWWASICVDLSLDFSKFVLASDLQRQLRFYLSVFSYVRLSPLYISPRFLQAWKMRSEKQ